MESYKAPLHNSEFTRHDVLLTFQFNTGVSQVVTEMGGKRSGVKLINHITNWIEDVKAEWEVLVVPKDNAINEKHVVYLDESEKHPFGKVEKLKFFTPTQRTEFYLNIQEACDYLIGVEIINYEYEGVRRIYERP